MRCRKILISALLSTALLACGDSKDDRFRASSIMEGTSVKVAAQTGGQILELPVDEGDQVAMGALLATIDSEKLRYQLEQVEAGLQEIAVQAQVSRNTLAITRSELVHVETKFQRIDDLYRKNSATEQMRDDLKQAVDAARTQVLNAEQQVKLIESKEAGLQAQKKLLKRQIDDATVEAPMAGWVTTTFFEAGETVAPGMPVVEIIDLRKMWTKIFVSERKLPQVALGQEAEIRIDGTEASLSGEVTWISPNAEFTPKNILTDENRTALVYAVKVSVENPDRLLKHGMPVVVNLMLE